jgi:putative tricarboxylic transport membrane protein
MLAAMMLNRRHLLLHAALGSLAGRAWATTPSPVKPAAPLLPALRIYIPGGAGGGWDQTGHALGEAIQAAGLVPKVDYENKGGKGGTIGLADFVERFDHDPAALMIGGMVMVGAIAASAPKVTLAQVTPLAKLTNDYLAVVSLPKGPFADLKAVSAQLRQKVGSVVFTGGSLGGVDHMLAGMLVRQLKLDTNELQYLPATAAKDSIALLESGKAQVLISGFSELKPDIEAKRLVPLAVSSARTLRGIPSLSEQGVPIELANWRGVFCAGGITDLQKAALRSIVVGAAESPHWSQTLKDKDWLPALLSGASFAQSLEIDGSIAGVVAHMLKLRS